MIKCPQCKGSGEITFTITEISPEKPTVTRSSTTDCFTCKGSGTVTPQVATQYAMEKAAMCKCERSEPGPYYKDGECPDCWKHHQHCQVCGLICMIG